MRNERKSSESIDKNGSPVGSVLFYNNLARFADNIALIEGDRHITYASLIGDADAVGARVGPSRRLVFLEARNTIEAVTAYIGCLRAGHVVHLFGEGEEARVKGLIEIYRPHAVVRHETPGPSVIERRHDDEIALHPDLALLLSTSGSTGSPKFVKLSRHNIHANATAIAEYLELDATERAITTLKFNYSYGLSVIHSHLACGASLILTESSVTTPGFWPMFEAQGATSFAGVPYIFEMLDRTSDWAAQPNLRYVTQAGGRLAPDIVRRMAELGQGKGWRFFVMYGQTEAAPRMTYLPPEHTIDHPDSIGRAVPGGVLSLIDETGATIVSPETAGELIYAGPNVMMGYAEGPGALATDETQDSLKTGDIAVRLANGLYRIVGRSSRFIKPFGIRLNLDELQAQVRERAAGTICTGTDERLVVAVPGGLDDQGALVGWLTETYGLPAFLIEILSVAEIPLLPSGKPDYQALIRLAAEKHPPANAVNETAANGRWDSITTIFTTLTGAKTVTGDSTFITLAGDSLSYVVTSLAVEEYLGFLPNDWETKSVDVLEALRHADGEKDVAVPLHFLNTGRVLMLFLGIPFHAAMVFNAKADMIISAPERSWIATVIFMCLHAFRMFAYFFISGYFSMLILKRTTALNWFTQQAKRLGFPLILGGLILVPLEVMAVAISPVRTGLPPWQFWVQQMTSPGPQWLSHRWFLATLLVVGAFMAILITLHRKGRFGLLPERFLDLIDKNTAVCWWLLVAGLAPLGLASTVAAKLVGNWAFLFETFEYRTIIMYAPVFFVGSFMFLRPKAFEWYLKPSLFTIGLTVVLTAAFVILADSKTLPLMVLEQLNVLPVGMLATRVFLSAMHRWANSTHPVITRLLDASYVIYIWHIVFVLLFNDLWISLRLNPLVAITLTTVGSFGCCWLVYLVVCRSRLLSLIFNGGPLRGA